MDQAGHLGSRGTRIEAILQAETRGLAIGSIGESRA
jgi:hypothetical protein